MKNKINDGGPAFPFPVPTFDTNGCKIGHSTEQPGMTLRDHFAGLAMQGMLAGISPIERINLFSGHSGNEPYLAAASYRIADAMIAERENGKA